MTSAIVARLLGGRLLALERLPVHDWPLVAGTLAGVGLGAAAPWTGLAAAAHWVGLACAAGCALAYALRNRAVHGMGLIGLGLVLNAVVVAGNTGMPVSADAATRAGVDYAAAASRPGRVPDGPDVTLRMLGDVVPLPLPYRPAVVSLGDLLVAAGLSQLLATAMLPDLRATPTPHRGTRPAPPRPAPPRPAPSRPARLHLPAARRRSEPGPPPPDLLITDLGDEHTSEVLRVFRPGDPVD
ncbi:MAG: DUF5317 domain-containing protein [Actinobacteria bacterium]|nr:DUF5317 domain-containing protein [Actinomycetota bacterium]MBI3686650.1 DUF5317 domain-containing protein [Actinomycetota bacterium]